MFDQEFSNFKEAITDRDTEKATTSLVNIAILTAGCPKTKALLDAKLDTETGGLKIASDITLQDFTNEE